MHGGLRQPHEKSFGGFEPGALDRSLEGKFLVPQRSQLLFG